MTRYIETTEAARLIRRLLKQRFPQTLFSVRSHKYAGGSSIDVTYDMDAPAPRHEVDLLVRPFEGRGFDGSIDMAYARYAYLLPDGSAVPAATEGTAGSLGAVQPERAFKPAPEAERVKFGVDYIFVSRI